MYTEMIFQIRRKHRTFKDTVNKDEVKRKTEKTQKKKKQERDLLTRTPSVNHKK